MRKVFLIILLVVVLVSACHTANTEIKERIFFSDSVAINYFSGDGNMDTVVSVKIIRDKKVIEKLCNLISMRKQKGINKCGYDGSLHFFKQNIVIQNIDFRMNEKDCMQFSFMQNGMLTATVLTAEAKGLLERLKQ